MRICFFIWAILFSASSSIACTTFFINKNGQLVFGRNYDWVSGNGMVCTNQRGLSKTSFKNKDGNTISWTSKYGSITFNQYGKEFPTGGMNEKGLVIELMWLDGTRYPEPDNRPALGVLQWIQYHLDICSTVDELIAEDQHVRITSNGAAPLHYLVADASGNAATIEFLDGKMKVHKGNDLTFPVLTNDTYSSSIQQTAFDLKSGGNSDRIFTSSSIDRFAQACSMVNRYQKEKIPVAVVDYSFSILDAVAQGSHTKWSIVYDISNKKIYFKTLGYPQRKEIAFSAFDFNCKSVSKSWDMNQSVVGDITSLFRNYSSDFNTKIIERSADESSSQISISAESIRQTAMYPAQVSCALTSH